MKRSPVKRANHKVKIGAFEVAPGVRSITRYMFAFVIINVVAMGWYVLLRGNVTSVEAILISSEIGLITALKLVQKRQEIKQEMNLNLNKSRLENNGTENVNQT